MPYVEKDEREQPTTTETPNAAPMQTVTYDFATFQAIVTASVTAALVGLNASSNCLTSRVDTHTARQEAMNTPTEPSRGGRKKRKFWDKKKEHVNQGQLKKQPTMASTTQIPVRPYLGSFPKCDRCLYHHRGPCRDMQCIKCGREGHTARSCRAPVRRITRTTDTGTTQTCYGCGKKGHFKRNCPVTKNGNAKNEVGVLTLWTVEDNQDLQ